MNTLTSLSGASQAYRAAKDMSATPVPAENTPPSRSFAELVQDTAIDTIETIRAGDRAAIAGIKGEMSTQDVVEATMAMESALQVTIAVRDKVLEAYQEVMRMAV